MFILVENHIKKVNDIASKKIGENEVNNGISIVPKIKVDRLISQLSMDSGVLNPFGSLSNLRRNKGISFRTVAMVVVKTLKHRKKCLLKHERDIIKQNIKFKNFIKEM